MLVYGRLFVSVSLCLRVSVSHSRCCSHSRPHHSHPHPHPQSLTLSLLPSHSHFCSQVQSLSLLPFHSHFRSFGLNVVALTLALDLALDDRSRSPSRFRAWPRRSPALPHDASSHRRCPVLMCVSHHLLPPFPPPDKVAMGAGPRTPAGFPALTLTTTRGTLSESSSTLLIR